MNKPLYQILASRVYRSDCDSRALSTHHLRAAVLTNARNARGLTVEVIPTLSPSHRASHPENGDVSALAGGYAWQFRAERRLGVALLMRFKQKG